MFGPEHPLYRVRVEGVRPQCVQGIGREGDQASLTQTFHGLLYTVVGQCGLRYLGYSLGLGPAASLTEYSMGANLGRVIRQPYDSPTPYLL